MRRYILLFFTLLVLVGCSNSENLDINTKFNSSVPTNLHKLVWEKSLKTKSDMSIYDDILVFGSIDGVYGLSPKDGREIFYIKTQDKVDITPILKNNIIYFPSIEKINYEKNYFLNAVNIKTKEILWKFKTKSKIESFIIANGFIYIGTKEGYLYKISIDNGSKKWSYFVKSAIEWEHIIDNTIFLGTDNNILFALDIATGNEKWHSQLSKSDNVFLGFPTFSKNTIYIPFNSIVRNYSYNKKSMAYIYAINIYNGKIKWKTAPFKNINIALTTLLDNILYFPEFINFDAKNVKIYALDIQTTQLKWTKTLKEDFMTGGVISIGNNNLGVFIGISKEKEVNLYTIDLETQTILWKFRAENEIDIDDLSNISIPLIYNNKIYFSDGKNIYTIE